MHKSARRLQKLHAQNGISGLWQGLCAASEAVRAIFSQRGFFGGHLFSELHFLYEGPIRGQNLENEEADKFA
jgi:hypothetical protein